MRHNFSWCPMRHMPHRQYSCALHILEKKCGSCSFIMYVNEIWYYVPCASRLVKVISSPHCLAPLTTYTALFQSFCCVRLCIPSIIAMYYVNLLMDMGTWTTEGLLETTSLLNIGVRLYYDYYLPCPEVFFYTSTWTTKPYCFFTTIMSPN